MLALSSIQEKGAEDGFKKIILCLTANNSPIKAIHNNISLTSSACSHSKTTNTCAYTCQERNAVTVSVKNLEIQVCAF